MYHENHFHRKQALLMLITANIDYIQFVIILEILKKQIYNNPNAQ